MKKPSKCFCCGRSLDNDKKSIIHGPYLYGPYEFVCHSCWEKDFLFFPDKISKYTYKKALDLLK